MKKKTNKKNVGFNKNIFESLLDTFKPKPDVQIEALLLCNAVLRAEVKKWRRLFFVTYIALMVMVVLIGVFS